jgi:hypothetical protein
VDFRGQPLFDPGAFPEPPLSGKLTWNVLQPWAEPDDDDELAAKLKALERIRQLKERQAGNALADRQNE